MSLVLRFKMRKAPKRAPLRLVLAREKALWIVRVRPWVTIPAGLCFFMLAIWYLFATIYLVSRDDLMSARASDRAADVEAVAAPYRDEIAELKMEIERLTSRHHVAQRLLEGRIEALLIKQARLESRHSRVAELVGDAVPPPLPRPMPGMLNRAREVRASLDGSGIRLGFAGGAAMATPLSDLPAIEPIAIDKGSQLKEIEESLSRIEVQQGVALNHLVGEAQRTAKAIRTTLIGLGVPLSRAVKRDETGIAQGGPFEPITDEKQFQSRVSSAEQAMDRLNLLKSEAKKLPLAMPVSNPITSSGFGRRRDPFLGRPAMHTGLDFRARTGTAVYATAPGTVVTASYTGGYGKMVEIAHADGVTTRLAHLSRIAAVKGDRVEAGQIVGYVGSTGRSTGPHLHYETRIGGVPLNPTRFIQAGKNLADILQEH